MHTLRAPCIMQFQEGGTDADPRVRNKYLFASHTTTHRSLWRDRRRAFLCVLTADCHNWRRASSRSIRQRITSCQAAWKGHRVPPIDRVHRREAATNTTTTRAERRGRCTTCNHNHFRPKDQLIEMTSQRTATSERIRRRTVYSNRVVIYVILYIFLSM